MEKFPLQWPAGYKRTTYRKRSQFKQTNEGAQRALNNEIRMLGATDLIVSTNIPVRNDGGFYAKYADGKNMDPGVAIYFKYKNKPVSMCCDTYSTVWENVYALAKGIEALRGMDRWGVSEFLDRALTGFAALPAAAHHRWHTVLGWDVLPNPTLGNWATTQQEYKIRARKLHPDNMETGNAEKFVELQGAYEEAKKHFNNVL